MHWPLSYPLDLVPESATFDCNPEAVDGKFGRANLERGISVASCNQLASMQITACRPYHPANRQDLRP